MRRYGIDESSIMKIGAWKTRSVFDRYNIVNEADIAEPAPRIDEARKLLAATDQIEPSATTTATSRTDDAYPYVAMNDNGLRVQSLT